MSAVVLVLASTPAAGETVPATSSGTSDELVAPPSLSSCNNTAFLPSIAFEADGTPIGVPRLGVGPGLVTSFEISISPLGPGTISLDEVITYDGHAERDTLSAQPDEKVRIEFLLDGNVQAVTRLTPDVPDSTLSAWVTSDLGSHDLPNGANALRVVHSSAQTGQNSVVISAICGSHTPVDAPAAATPPVCDTATDGADAAADAADATVCDDPDAAASPICDTATDGADGAYAEDAAADGTDAADATVCDDPDAAASPICDTATDGADAADAADAAAVSYTHLTLPTIYSV